MYQHFSRPDRYLSRCGHLDVTLVERPIGGAPSFMRGMRALFVADTHVLPRTTRADLDALMGRIAGAKPDMLLLGGDYSDAAGDTVRFFEAMEGIRPPLGSYAVIGNNDAEAWAGRLDELRAIMARQGCELLCNGAVRVPRNGGTIHIAGVDEYKFGGPDAAGLLPEAPRPDAYRILLSHYPVLTPLRPELMLCGHTHGGQFNLLGLTPFAIGFERLNRPRRASAAISGLREIDGMKLLVTKGIGASRIQLRIGVRPEMELLVFG